MVALLAILHLVVLVGLGVFLWGSGRLDAEKVEQIAAVMRGEDSESEAARRTASQPAVTPVLARASSEKIAEAQTSDEVARLVGERLLREAADRKVLVDAAMLKVIRQHEALATEKNEFKKARELASSERQHSGLKAELEILSKLSEKNARDVLMKKPVPDAVNVLMKMKTRSAAGIIEACKTEAEKAWAVQMMQEISSRDEDKADALEKAAR